MNSTFYATLNWSDSTLFYIKQIRVEKNIFKLLYIF